MVLHYRVHLPVRHWPKCLFFLDVGQCLRPSRISIQFHMVSYCSAIKYLIYYFQDIHVGDKNINGFEKDWSSEVIISSKSESPGVAILFRGDLNFMVREIEKDDAGNLIPILQVCDLNFYLCVLCGPNTTCLNFMQT